MNKRTINKKISRRRTIRKIRRIFIFLFIPIILLIIGFIFLMNTKIFALNDIDIYGDKYLDKDKIKKIINSDIEGKNNFFILNRNFIFYPESKIENDLKKNFIEIKDVDISYKSFINYKNIKIDIEQKEKKYLWCEDDEHKKCKFVLNNSEIAEDFDQEKTPKKKEDFIVILGKIDKKIDKKTKKNKIIFFKTIDKFIEFEKIVDSFVKTGLKIKDIKKDDNREYIIRTKDNVKIIVPDIFSEEVLENFKIVGNNKEISFDNKTSSFNPKLEYINFSLSNKSIVYCFKEDECVGNY